MVVGYSLLRGGAAVNSYLLIVIATPVAALALQCDGALRFSFK